MGDLSKKLDLDTSVPLDANLAGGAWTPADITSATLLAWYDADSAYVALNGSEVITWTPRAGTRITAAPTQGTGSKRPTWSSTGVAVSVPTVTFDGGDVLRLAHALAGDFDEPNAHQVFSVGRMQANAGEQHIWCAGRDDQDTLVGEVLSGPGNLRYIRKLLGGQGILVSAISLADDVDHWHYTAWASNTAYAGATGETEGSGSVVRASTGLTDWALGCRVSNGTETRFVNAEISHIVVTDSQLSAEEQALLKAWADEVNAA